MNMSALRHNIEKGVTEIILFFLTGEKQSWSYDLPNHLLNMIIAVLSRKKRKKRKKYIGFQLGSTLYVDR